MKTINLLDLKRIVKIEYSDYPYNPRKEDYNLATMVCFHNSFSLGDKHNYKYSDYNSFAEMERDIIRKENVAVILPLYLYNHSGITISVTPFNCRFDSGQIGFIFVSKKRVLEEFGGKIVTQKLKNKMTEYLIGEVDEYDKYLRGECFSFEVIDSETNEVIDSCSGFLGDDVDNGIYDNLGIEGLTFDRYTKEYENN